LIVNTVKKALVASLPDQIGISDETSINLGIMVKPSLDSIDDMPMEFKPFGKNRSNYPWFESE